MSVKLLSKHHPANNIIIIYPSGDPMPLQELAQNHAFVYSKKTSTKSHNPGKIKISKTPLRTRWIQER